jgi:hypothetical protein
MGERVDPTSSSSSPLAKAGGRWRLARRWRLPRRRARLASCPVCHGGVAPDDALGLIGGRVAHAECALVSWLGPGRLSAELR